MTQDFELVSHHLCPYVQRAAIALAEKRVPFRRTYVDLGNKPGWFTAISPLGKVPLLRTEGTVLFESAVICEYLDEVTPGSLHPADPLEKARHRAWIEFGSALLNDIWGLYMAADTQAFEAKRLAIAAKFAALEAEIAGPWFGGTAFHLVDAVYGPVFRYFDAFERHAELGLFHDKPKVTAWRRALSARASVRDAVTPDYSERLDTFLRTRGSHLSRLMA